MAENLDARLLVNFPGHAKTKKLIKRLGGKAAGFALVCLWLYARQARPTGDLTGLTDEDIEIAADWDGPSGAFVAALADVGFLDGAPDAYRLHDWGEHQPWASGSQGRALKARWNAVKRHHGTAEADRLVPEYGKSRNATSKEIDACSNAPSPSPSPSPSPKEKEQGLEAGASKPAKSKTKKATQGETDKVCATVVWAYHDRLPSCRQVSVLTPKRKRRIQAAHKMAGELIRQQGWRMEGKQFWLAYFDECAGDPWLRGDVPNPNNPRWRQNLDVLLAEDRFAEIMDKAIAASNAKQGASA